MTTTLQKSLDTFFSGPDKVLVIRGNWGVGKTYSWDSYVTKRIEEKTLKHIAYSYVSLFGKSSLAELRSSIFHNARPLSSEDLIDAEIDKRLTDATKLHDRLPWVRNATDLAKHKAPFMGWISKMAKSVPYADKFAPLLSTLEYSLVGNYIVCIDDLERKSSALSIREIMGLIDELAQRKSCKIILIFNEKSLATDTDRSEFESYREKVVDAEIEFSPSHAENLSKVFPTDHRLYKYFFDAVVALDLKNIRVLKKLRRMTDLVEAALSNCNDEILLEYVNHSTILLWSFYMRSEALSHSFVVKQLSTSSWAAYLNEEKAEPTEEERRYKSITSAIRIAPSIFDSHILDYLKCGYFDLNVINREVQEQILKAEIRHASARLNAVWTLYTDSFLPNKLEIVEQFRTVLREEVSRLPVREYSDALGMLDSLGNDPKDLMHLYLELHKDELTSVEGQDSRIARRVSYLPMRKEIDEWAVEHRKLELDDITLSIAKHQGWNPGDIEFLATLTADDYYRWIQSAPSDLPLKLRSGLLFFRNLSGSQPEDNEKYSKIYASVEAALRRLASESDIGKLRVKHIYDIDTAS